MKSLLVDIMELKFPKERMGKGLYKTHIYIDFKEFPEIYADWKLRPQDDPQSLINLEPAVIQVKKIIPEVNKQISLSKIVEDYNWEKEWDDISFVISEARLNQIIRDKQKKVRDLFTGDFYYENKLNREFCFFVIPEGWRKVYHNVFVYIVKFHRGSDDIVRPYDFHREHLTLGIVPLNSATYKENDWTNTLFFFNK